jgi:hypothetical protein
MPHCGLVKNREHNMESDGTQPFARADRSVVGVPLILLKAEGLAVFALATFAYSLTGQSWWIYLVLFLFPDLSFFAYMAGNRPGSVAYNAVHSYVGPALVGFAGYESGQPAAIAVALIWTAHIGIDRALGYGLKYATAFGDTHLGQKGRAGGKKRR